MNIITCASYHGTGSSAVTDFFGEFSNCNSIGEFELRFIHDPCGIRDLEYNLIENNNRLNTSNAIKNFKKYVNYLNGNILRKRYRRYLGKNFIKYSEKYIDNITELCSDAYWHYDEMKRGELFELLSTIYRKFCFKTPQGESAEKSLLQLKHEKGYYSAIDKKTFYKYTKEYINEVINCINIGNAEYIMVDQLLPPSNINQYLNYFDDVKVIVVDRDPRDLFILADKIWKTGIIPHKNVEDFCAWYEITRRHRKRENLDTNYSMYMQFEDLIYKYNETTQKLIEFVGINPQKHIRPMTMFIPTISIKNTNLKKNFSKYKKEIEYIENNLAEYLYHFPE